MNINMFLTLLHKFKPDIGNTLFCQPYDCKSFYELDTYIPNNVYLIKLIFPLQFRDDVLIMTKLCGCTIYYQKYITKGQYGHGLYFNKKSFADVELIISL